MSFVFSPHKSHASDLSHLSHRAVQLQCGREPGPGLGEASEAFVLCAKFKGTPKNLSIKSKYFEKSKLM